MAVPARAGAAQGWRSLSGPGSTCAAQGDPGRAPEPEMRGNSPLRRRVRGQRQGLGPAETGLQGPRRVASERARGPGDGRVGPRTAPEGPTVLQDDRRRPSREAAARSSGARGGAAGGAVRVRSERGRAASTCAGAAGGWSGALSPGARRLTCRPAREAKEGARGAESRVRPPAADSNTDGWCARPISARSGAGRTGRQRPIGERAGEPRPVARSGCASGVRGTLGAAGTGSRWKSGLLST